MFLEELKLFNFRNLVDDTITFSPGINFIVGRNGQGKTNLIEAIALLSSTRSFRTAACKEMVRWGEKEASVFAKIRDPLGQRGLGMVVSSGTRQLYVNGEKAKSVVDVVGKLISVSFTPYDLLIVKGPPAGRRKFFDKHVVDMQPALLGNFLTYARALKNKNQILKQGGGESAHLEMQLKTWDKLLIESAVPIIAARKKFIEELQKRANALYSRFAPDSEEEIGLEIKSNVPVPLEDAVREQFEKNRAREIARESSITGPHRDDVDILLGGMEAKAYASQGQTRSIVLALKLGVIEMLREKYQESPLVLLDDVESELDQQRAEALLEMVLGPQQQVFITGTNRAIGEQLKALNLQKMEISSGRVTILN